MVMDNFEPYSCSQLDSPLSGGDEVVVVYLVKLSNGTMDYQYEDKYKRRVKVITLGDSQLLRHQSAPTNKCFVIRGFKIYHGAVLSTVSLFNEVQTLFLCLVRDSCRRITPFNVAEETWVGFN
jgi:hypothetical protein